MLSRRSMLRALGFGAPAAAVAATLPAATPAAPMIELSHPSIHSRDVSMTTADMGEIVIGKGGFEPFMFIDAEGPVHLRGHVLVNDSLVASGLSVSDLATASA